MMKTLAEYLQEKKLPRPNTKRRAFIEYITSKNDILEGILFIPVKEKEKHT